jgi:ribosomal protein S18 acetylase RimI-like enzyme
MVDLSIRQLRPTDYGSIVAVLDDWWGGRRMRTAFPRLFVDHFWSTSFVAEKAEEVIGFLVGFLSPSQPVVAYVHFMGVHPQYRGRGIGRLLYQRFFELARRDGRTEVRAITSPTNRDSIAFHLRLGFEIEKGQGQENGMSVQLSYGPNGESRVVLVKTLS